MGLRNFFARWRSRTRRAERERREAEQRRARREDRRRATAAAVAAQQAEAEAGLRADGEARQRAEADARPRAEAERAEAKRAEADRAEAERTPAEAHPQADTEPPEVARTEPNQTDLDIRVPVDPAQPAASPGPGGGDSVATVEPGHAQPATPRGPSPAEPEASPRRGYPRVHRPRPAPPLAAPDAMALLTSMAADALPDRAAQALIGLARPAIGLTTSGPAQTQELAGSRLGGVPLLNPNAEWPHREDRPLHFVGQIRLDHVAAYDTQLALPRLGLLSVFYLPEDDVYGYDPTDRDAWRVLVTNPTVAREREAPAGAEAYDPVALSTQTTYTVPDRYASALNPVREAAGDADLDALLSAYELHRGRLRHQLLGWPQEGNDSMVRAAAMASAGEYAGAGQAEVDGGTLAGWRLLVQLDSEDDAGMIWGDECRLCFWLPEPALRAGRFAESWMVMRCG